MNIAQIAVPLPLRKTYDFLVPEHMAAPPVGARVRVPFGRRELIGIVVANKAQSDMQLSRLKPLLEVIDQDSIFAPALWRTLQWISTYYLAPIGEVYDIAMPVRLRQGKAIKPASKLGWQLTEQGRTHTASELMRAPLQQAIFERFSHQPVLNADDFEGTSWRSAMRALVNKGWLEQTSTMPSLAVSDEVVAPVKLNTEQQNAASALSDLAAKEAFSVALVHGVTGSGKTEVYLSVMREVIEQGKQVLMLVPEIGLTPQLVARVQSSLNCSVVILHSALNEGERHLAWWHAQQGEAKVVIGTRSAVFTALPELGLIVIDEEHDASFKQQDGVRYQARDVAIYRAKQENVPCVLGSATPSLESLNNAQQGRFKLLQLKQRANLASLPDIELLDLTRLPARDGLSQPLVEAIGQTLASNQQVMLFLNRRGFAPVLYCKSCKHVHTCHRCDSNLVLHQHQQRLRCHHCGYECRSFDQCSSCGEASLAEVGEGTQRVEQALIERFPDARVLRVDRDSTSRKGELEAKLALVAEHQVDIVLGTQLLAKGHDFPSIALVGVIGADQGLHSIDFHAQESLFQQLMQVSGRAGRRDRKGRVLIQTAFAGEPFFEDLTKHRFDRFAERLLKERQQAMFPPFGFLAVVRAEATQKHKSMDFLRAFRHSLPQHQSVVVMDALPAPMERRAGRFRAQLLIRANNRADLNHVLNNGLHQIEYNADLKRLAAAVRWSLDIDPLDLY